MLGRIGKKEVLQNCASCGENRRGSRIIGAACAGESIAWLQKMWQQKKKSKAQNPCSFFLRVSKNYDVIWPCHATCYGFKTACKKGLEIKVLDKDQYGSIAEQITTKGTKNTLENNMDSKTRYCEP